MHIAAMTQEGSRRLAAVWFADIVGYTELSARDQDLALRVVRELQRIARMQCDAPGGRVVKLLGNAVLAVFDSADGAVRAAVGLRDAFIFSFFHASTGMFSASIISLSIFPISPVGAMPP